MRMCFDKRVLIGLGVVAVGLFAVSPSLLGSVAPLLVFAVCPLSMVFMMRAMSRGGASCGADQGSQQTSDAATGTAGDAELRELQEEVNRLKAERTLRDQQRAG